MKPVRYGQYHENPMFPKQRKHRPFVLPVILATFIVLAGFSVLLWGPWFSVSYIAVEGNLYAPTAEVERIALDALKKKHLWILPKNNTIFFPRSAIEHAVKLELERAHALESLTVTAHMPSGLTISIKERTPNVYYVINAHEYTIDRQGFLTERVEEGKPKKDFPTLRDQNGRDVSVGKAVVGAPLVEYLFAFDTAVREQNIVPKDYYIPPLSCFAFQKVEIVDEKENTSTPSDDEEGSDNSNDNTNSTGNENTNIAPVARLPELVQEACKGEDAFLLNKELRVRTEEGWDIYVRSDEDAETHVNRLMFVLDEKKIDRATMHYIDLRFGETVVYR